MYTRKTQLAPASMPGAIGPSSLNEAARTVECTFGNGAAVARSSPSLGNYIEKLDMGGADLSRAAAGIMPVLDTHSQDSINNVIGTVESAVIRNGVGYATLRITDDTAWAKIKDGTVKGVSIGYRQLSAKDVSAKNASNLELLVTKFEVFEISLCPVAADPSAQIRSSNQTHLCEVISAKPEGNKMDKEKSEELRKLKIEKQVRASGLSEEFAQDLVTRGVSLEEATSEIFKKLEEQTAKGQKRSIVGVEVSSVNEDVRRNGFVEALISRDNPNYKVQNPEAARLYQGRSLLGAMEVHLQGRKLGESDIQFATRAMTTSDLPFILSNYGEKQMRQEYAVQTPTFAAWTKPGTLRNYKNAYRLMLGDFPSLDTLDEHGEIKSGSMGETKENIQLGRYAKSITMTKEMLTNDDLSSLNSFSTKSARAAIRLESSLVYTSTLLANTGAGPTMGDGIALFHASHGNLGSGTAISLASVTAGWSAIRAQKTVDGTDYLDLIPKFLICGLAKEAEAQQFASQSLLATKFSDVNPLAGKLTVVVDPRITGNQWYLSADPSQIDTIEVARLESEGGPVVRVVMNQENQNMKIICEHSVGAAVLDYRGLYRNPGN